MVIRSTGRVIYADHQDPDRQESLKVTNFLAGRPIKESAAIYALAMQASFRGLSYQDYMAVLDAIFSTCVKGWNPNADEQWCSACHGAGTIYRGNLSAGIDPALQTKCEACNGTGAAIVP